jgi:hypothetical protein
MWSRITDFITAMKQYVSPDTYLGDIDFSASQYPLVNVRIEGGLSFKTRNRVAGECAVNLSLTFVSDRSDERAAILIFEKYIKYAGSLGGGDVSFVFHEADGEATYTDNTFEITIPHTLYVTEQGE